MKLTGVLKEKVENASSIEEAKKMFEDAEIKLTEEELDQVAGGLPRFCDRLSVPVSVPS